MPVLAGVNGTDPFRLMPVFLKQLKEMGFDGVQNFPTVGLIDGDFRANLEATGMGYDKEIETIRLAHEIDLFTSPYVFNADDAKAMAKAGADQLVAHVGLTTAGTIGAGVALTLDQAIDRVMTVAEAGRSVRSDILVLCHGGPFDEPDNVGEALARMPGVQGFFGASSIERLPTERGIRGQVKEFKQLKLAPTATGLGRARSVHRIAAGPSAAGAPPPHRNGPAVARGARRRQAHGMEARVDGDRRGARAVGGAHLERYRLHRHRRAAGELHDHDDPGRGLLATLRHGRPAAGATPGSGARRSPGRGAGGDSHRRASTSTTLRPRSPAPTSGGVSSSCPRPTGRRFWRGSRARRRRSWAAC